MFAAKWAEVVFVIYHSFEDAKKEYASFKAAVAAAGRDPARVHVAPACYVCIGERELQRRGLFHKDYAGPTLRDNLGLAIPRTADWHAAGRAPVG